MRIAPVATVNVAPELLRAAAAAASVSDVTPTKPCVGISSAPRAAGDACGSNSPNPSGAIQRASMPSPVKRLRQFAQPDLIRVRERQLEGAVALVDELAAAVGCKARHEVVVERETAVTKAAQQLGAVAFDVRRQDAGRCARRALPRRARFDHLHARAGPGELVRDGAADDAGADDDD